MTRVLGVFGFTGGFLMISPGLRQTVLEGSNFAATFVQAHSPYSYIAVVVAVFGGVTLSLLSGQSPR